MADGGYLPSLVNCPSSAVVGDCAPLPAGGATFTTAQLVRYIRECSEHGAHANPSHINLDRLRGYGLVHRLLNAIPDAVAQRERDEHVVAHQAEQERQAAEQEREEALARAAVAKWEAYTAERRKERAESATRAEADHTQLIAAASLVWLLDTMRDRAAIALKDMAPAGTRITLKAPDDDAMADWDFESMLDAALQLADRAGLAELPTGLPVPEGVPWM